MKKVYQAYLYKDLIMDELETTTERTMTKAGHLAMELSKEKKRLQQELDELQEEFDIVKPTTPTGTVDWYVKWVATLLAVAGVFLISANLMIYGQFAYIISTLGWIYVGMQWGDRAIMIGSSISGTAVAMNLVTALVTGV
tara:strand:+ start:71 stop:490 length:420 start_codon:yes stop_codon:yes gene_type:complete